MATISSVLTELLTEIDDICAGRGIKYAVTGKAAERIAGGGALDEEVVEPVVLMSGKGMTEFVEAFEQRDSERRIEYFGNSDRVNGLAVFYCAPDTTFIRVSDMSDYLVKGIRVRIEPFRKAHDGNAASQQMEIGWMCRENRARAYSSSLRRKAFRKANAELKKNKNFGAELFQALCLADGEGRAYVPDDLKQRYIEETVLDRTQTCLIGTGNVCCFRMKPFVREHADITKEIIVSAEIPYAQYERKAAGAGIDLERIMKLQQKSRLWHMITKGDDKDMENAWEIVLLSGDRLRLLQMYEGRIKDLIKLRDSGNYEVLEQELKPHEEAVMRNLSHDLGLMVHPDLSELQYEVFARRGEKDLVEKIQDLTSEKHNRPIL